MSLVRQILVLWVLLLGAAFAWSAPESAPSVPDAAATTKFAEALLRDRFGGSGPGAAVLVARGDTVLYRGAIGRASLELGVELKPEQRFRIGSLSKQFAAAGVLKLVDAGKLKLDDTLDKFLPDYPAAKSISIRQLLNHTAGIPDYTNIPDYFSEQVRTDKDTAGMIAVFKDLPADFAPGSSWSYSNSGYVLVGAVIEKVTGMQWYQWLEQSLFTPLKLEQTVFGAGETVFEGLVDGYSPGSGLIYNRALPLSMTQPHAAGALVSGVDDLFHWNRALHGGKVLSKASYQSMISPVEPALSAAQYGFGLQLGTLRGQPTIRHSGGINGFLSMLLYLPEAQITVVVLRNSDGNLPIDPNQLALRLAAFALGKPFPESSTIKLEEKQLAELQGVYRMDPQNARTVRLSAGSLTIQRTGGPAAELTPIGPDRFSYGNSLTMLKFERNEDRSIKGLRFFANGEDEDEGEFVPRTSENFAERESIVLPLTTLDRVVGDYMGPELAFTVKLDKQVLTLQIPGQPVFVLHAESETHFFIKEVDATVEFLAPSGTVVESAIFIQGSGRYELTRQSGAP